MCVRTAWPCFCVASIASMFCVCVCVYMCVKRRRVACAALILRRTPAAAAACCTALVHPAAPAVLPTRWQVWPGRRGRQDGLHGQKQALPPSRVEKASGGQDGKIRAQGHTHAKGIGACAAGCTAGCTCRSHAVPMRKWWWQRNRSRKHVRSPSAPRARERQHSNARIIVLFPAAGVAHVPLGLAAAAPLASHLHPRVCAVCAPRGPTNAATATSAVHPNPPNARPRSVESRPPRSNASGQTGLVLGKTKTIMDGIGDVQAARVRNCAHGAKDPSTVPLPPGAADHEVPPRVHVVVVRVVVARR